MTVTVPATDAVNFELQARINVLTSQITAAGNNGPLAFKLSKDKADLQLQLVQSLLASGRISASAVLTNESYAAGQPGGDHH